jgi:hypothetical protein
MIRRFIYGVAVATLFTATVFGQTIVVDTFSNTQTNILRTSVGSTTVLQTDASAIGGNRNVTNTLVSGTGNFDLIFNASVMQSTADAGVIGNYLLEYGSQTQLNVNASATNAFQFERFFLDLSAGFTVTLTSGNGANTATYTSGPNEIPGGGAPSQLVTVPFSAFSGIGSLVLTDLDQISFQFTAAQQATQFQLDNIRLINVSVPEPTTIALMGLSGLVVGGSVWMNRRKLTARKEARFKRA